jgi:Cu+-exporting ATPase
MEAADVVLVSGAPSAVATAREISRRTLRNIAQNLVWAFGYNVALIPVAAGVLAIFGGPLLSPMLAAGAMAASSVLVVANALRLKRVRAA